MTKVIFHADLRRLAKQANQRMVRLEQANGGAGIKSPAYESVQAKLEMLGRQIGDTKGRRFSETGKATYNEYEQLKKILEEFIYEQKTSTVKGAKQYIEAVWQGAQKSEKVALDLKKAGIGKDEWFEIWKNLPSNKKERMYSSSEYIEMVAVYKATKGKAKPDVDIGELVRQFEDSKNLKSAYKSLGLSYHDFEVAESMGVL